MTLQVIVLFAAALFSAGAAVFAYRNVNRLKKAGDKKAYEEQLGSPLALGFLSAVLVILATHQMG